MSVLVIIQFHMEIKQDEKNNLAQLNSNDVGKWSEML